jgi:hypothetical protein
MSNVYPISPSVDVTVTTDDGSSPSFDADSNATVIPLADGAVEVSWGPPKEPKKETENFNDNLADELSESNLSIIAERLLAGIDQDLQTRSAWLENMSNGISLLGLEIKNPRGAAASGATPAEGTSTVDHPLLLEAVLRFQANARGELLPTDGPVKVRNDGEGNALADQLAEALEKDMNHYLTKTAKEYYPDTDRMLLMLGFAGISFKKGFHDPIKRRPVIASIDAKDLIVSNTATDIDGAGRVTHRIMMRPSVLRRMQLLGAYRDIALPVQGMPAPKNAVETKIDQVQGIAPATYVEPADQDRELYECYCEIDVPGFEHELEGQETGLPLPYKVTIDKDARRILEIRRNWEEDDAFCMARNRIIAYIFIPGLGFYGIGLLNVLGNAAKAVTAAWRLMIDAGMFANFPGFLYLKSLGKQLTNQFRVAPGSGMPVDTVGNDIRASIMPLPYKDPSAVFIQLIENIATTAQRVGGTAEMQIGEGKQDAPVGTTLALIEQATKLMSAVHKRLHQAQGQEFDMLKSLLLEDPEALWRHNKKSKVLKLLKAMPPEAQQMVQATEGAEQRHRNLFLAALVDCELTPRADPNTSSQTERYLKVVAARQMAQTNPNIDLNAVDKRAFQTMGFDDADSLFKPAPPPGATQPTPEQITAEATKTAAEARLLDSQTKKTDAEFRAANSGADRTSKEKIASLNLAHGLVIHRSDKEKFAAKAASDERNRSADRVSKFALASSQQEHQRREGIASRRHEHIQGGLGRQHEAMQGIAQRRHEFSQGIADRTHQGRQAAFGRMHDIISGSIDKSHESEQSAADREHEQELATLAPPEPKGVKKKP